MFHRCAPKPTFSKRGHHHIKHRPLPKHNRSHLHPAHIPGKLTHVNFLAHLYLAEPTPASWIGNLLPDLTTGPTDPDLHPDVIAGAANHRRVDAYTDTHPVFARTRARFRDKHG